MDIQQILSLSSPKGPAPVANEGITLDGSDLDDAAFADRLAQLAAIGLDDALADGPPPQNMLEQAGLPPQQIKALQAALQDGDLEALSKDGDLEALSKKVIEMAPASASTETPPVGESAAPGNVSEKDLAAMQNHLELIQRSERLSAGGAIPAGGKIQAGRNPQEPLAQAMPGLYRNLGTQEQADPSINDARPTSKDNALGRQITELSQAPSADAKTTLNPPSQKGIQVPPSTLQQITEKTGNTQEATGYRGQHTSDLPGLPTQIGASAPSATVSPASTPNLPAAVGTPDWSAQLGQQMMRLSRAGGEQRVELRLHPAELGSLTVHLKMGDQGAQAQFLSAHATVRQTIEQAIPQLREALADQGIELSETGVGEHPQGSGAEEPSQDRLNGQSPSLAEDSGNPSGSAETDSSAATEQPITLDGRIDVYA